MTDQERFEHYVYPDPNSGCFLWAGSQLPKGHGQFRYEGRTQLAHRVAWLLAGRELPQGRLLLHACNTACCVNVDHLYLGSHDDNAADASRAGTARRGLLPYGVRRDGRRFQAHVRRVYLGSFVTPEEAHAAAIAYRDRLLVGLGAPYARKHTAGA